MIYMEQKKREYLEKWADLNMNQQQAVDAIEGPVMVLAGPGTGKTQLLSMRVGRILLETDMTPSNILCLTFTNAAAREMTERMAKLLGDDAYKVGVYTFHSFSEYVKNLYPEYFHDGAGFKVVDEINKSELLGDIIAKLPHSNPLSRVFNDQPIYLKDCLSAISDIKRAGLLPDELLTILDETDAYIDVAEPILQKFFSSSPPRKHAEIEAWIDQFQKLSQKLPNDEEDEPALDIPDLANIVLAKHDEAITETNNNDKPTTKFVTAFRNQFLEKNSDNDWQMSDRKRSERLRALVVVYKEYLTRMRQNQWTDFDDLILEMISAIENNPELKYNLQEQFQYIMVDEFQDTNDSQMRVLRNLVDHDEKPNFFVVGDHKQSIFRFQGAEVANLERFYNQYKPEVVELHDTYRSSQPILNVADSVIKNLDYQGFFAKLDEHLTPHNPDKTPVQNIITQDVVTHHAAIASKIKQLIDGGKDPESIAVIAKKHRHLAKLVPFLNAANIPVQYEKEQKVLESEVVRQLELVARVCAANSAGQFDKANELMPELIAHPIWGLDNNMIWRLALAAQFKNWLDVMLDFAPETKAVAEKITELIRFSTMNPLEEVLDKLFAPYHEYYFSESKLRENPEKYLSYLNDLSELRNLVRDYRSQDELKLTDFVALLDAYKTSDTDLTVRRRYQSGNRVNLLTAHKSKGLEFDTVFILDAIDDTWGKGMRIPNKITFPANMKFSADTSEDEQIRLLYVAVTRAKNNLYLVSYNEDDKGGGVLPIRYLTDAEIDTTNLPVEEMQNLIDILELEIKGAWDERLTTVNDDLRELLAPTLEYYKLNATALNAFIDLENVGPNKFLLDQILRFPSAKSPDAEYGTAIHDTMKYAHNHAVKHKKQLSVPDAIKYFERNLIERHLQKDKQTQLLERGKVALESYLPTIKFGDNQQSEINFSNQGVMVDDVPLKGLVDLMEVNKNDKEIVVYDYKTGAAFDTFEKYIKNHRYKQQLMFYKLLIENSRDYSGYTVTRGVLHFVEPVDGKIKTLPLDLEYNDTEMAEFKKLIKSVYQHIMTLDFPKVDIEKPKLKDVLDFEFSLTEEI